MQNLRFALLLAACLATACTQEIVETATLTISAQPEADGAGTAPLTRTVLGEGNGNREFAESVFERFENPFIKHRLQSIALNSVSKFTVRCLPTMKEYREKFGVNPPCLCFALAALVAFYNKGTPDDDPVVTEKMKNGEFTALLKDASLFGEDISVFADDAKPHYDRIMNEAPETWYRFVKE